MGSRKMKRCNFVFLYITRGGWYVNSYTVNAKCVVPYYDRVYIVSKTLCTEAGTGALSSSVCLRLGNTIWHRM